MVKNHNSSDSHSGNRNFEGDRARVSQNRALRGVSLRRRGRNADSSGERINVVGGRRVNTFRMNGRHYADMPGLKRTATSPEVRKFRYMVFWKPYGVDVRFTGDRSPSELDYYIEVEHVLPVNFLDKDAEGLMLLTDDPKFRALLTHPKCAEQRIFLAQVENIPDEELSDILHRGVVLTENGSPDAVEFDVIPVPKLPSRSVPVRERKTVADAWTELRTASGSSRGVRRLLAQFGHPVLRLVLWGFGPISLTGMVPGMCRDFRYEEMRWVESKLEKLELPTVKSMIKGSRRHLRSGIANRLTAVKKRGANADRFACVQPKSEKRAADGSANASSKKRGYDSRAHKSAAPAGKSRRGAGQRHANRGLKVRSSASERVQMRSVGRYLR